MQNWQFNWMTSWREIFSDESLAIWNSVRQKNADSHIFFSVALVRAWVEAYGEFARIEPKFVLATGASGERVFLPLVLTHKDWRSAGVRILHPVGLTEYDYHAPLTAAQHIDWADFWQALVIEITSRWGCDFDQFSISGLHKKYLPHLATTKLADVAPYIDLTGFADKEQFLGSLRSSLRGDIRRQLRRLEELGEVSLKVYSPADIPQAMLALDKLLQEHSRHWPDSYKAPFFHRALVKHALAAGLLHFSELVVGGEVVSWHLGFCEGERFYWYMPAYLPQYQNYSPGKIHLFLCIDEAIKKGVRIFDLLKGDEGYKSQWANGFHDLYSFEVQGRRPGRYLRLLLNERIKPWLKKIHR